jgi:hypothetical protein
MLHGADRTVWLPENKRDAILTELKHLPKKKHCPIKRFLSITGKLINATRIAPATKVLLTPFFKAARHDPKFVGIGKASELRQALLDLPTLILDLTRHPTHVNEIVPHPPSVAGCCDASSHRAGGVLFSYEFDPVVWRTKWPDAVKELYRSGKLTNNDLEMAGVVAQTIVLERIVPMRTNTPPSTPTILPQRAGPPSWSPGWNPPSPGASFGPLPCANARPRWHSPWLNIGPASITSWLTSRPAPLTPSTTAPIRASRPLLTLCFSNCSPSPSLSPHRISHGTCSRLAKRHIRY